MKHVEQHAEWYRNYEDVWDIYNDINDRIANGWRVHTAIKVEGEHTIIIYERDLADSELRG